MRNESDKSGELENYKNTHLMEKKNAPLHVLCIFNSSAAWHEASMMKTITKNYSYLLVYFAQRIYLINYS